MLNIDYINLMNKQNFLLHLKSAIKYTKTMQKLILKTVKINKKQQDEVVDKIRLSFVEPEQFKYY